MMPFGTSSFIYIEILQSEERKFWEVPQQSVFCSPTPLPIDQNELLDTPHAFYMKCLPGEVQST